MFNTVASTRLSIMLYIFRIKLACTTRPYGVVQAKEGCDTQWSKFVDLCDLCHSRCRQQV